MKGKESVHGERKEKRNNHQSHLPFVVNFPLSRQWTHLSIHHRRVNIRPSRQRLPLRNPLRRLLHLRLISPDLPHLCQLRGNLLRLQLLQAPRALALELPSACELHTTATTSFFECFGGLLVDVDVGDGKFVAFFDGFGGDEVELRGTVAEGGTGGGVAGVTKLFCQSVWFLRHKEQMLT